MANNHFGAYLDIDLDAIISNWQYFRDNAPNSIAASVIKANAYGLGADKVAKKLQDAGCNHFFVAHLDEAIEARKYIAANSKIFVLNGIFPNEIDAFKEFNIIPVLNSELQIDLLKGENIPVALHIDTAMNRLGLRCDEVADNTKKIKELNLELIISHLAFGSDRNNKLNQQQLTAFKDATSGFDVPKSLSASSGSLLGKDFQFDLIRPGIGLYGGAPIDNEQNPLKTTTYLYSPIIQTRKLKSGEPVGYSSTFIAPHDMNIATIALGYADGFLRSGSGVCSVFVSGQKRPILGRVSMDLISIDITDLEGVKAGDYVEVLGNNVTLDAQAAAMNTISYEILTRLGSRFKRNYIGDK